MVARLFNSSFLLFINIVIVFPNHCISFVTHLADNAEIIRFETLKHRRTKLMNTIFFFVVIADIFSERVERSFVFDLPLLRGMVNNYITK